MLGLLVGGLELAILLVHLLLDLLGDLTLQLASGLQLGGLDLGFGDFLDLLGLFLGPFLLLLEGFLGFKGLIRPLPVLTLSRSLERGLQLRLLSLVFGLRLLNCFVLLLGLLLGSRFGHSGNRLKFIERLVAVFPPRLRIFRV